ncbi:hypothetical protein QJS04_geneDACA020137 [Acorus gramineus]|uniref:Aminotransferase-like plant mobile domain-containing protein n=1 Tax=Acorus gramineus TaxID=55184 RepID=A0AAV9BNF9_ACOGR|nr:hypothetical protein QJS04_geneDACA020137 [Acorus gramineus]
MSCGLSIEDDIGVKMMMNLYPKHVHGIELWLEKEETIQRGRCARSYDGDDSYPFLVRDPYQPSLSSFVPNTQENISFGTTPTNVHESAHGRPFGPDTEEDNNVEMVSNLEYNIPQMHPTNRAVVEDVHPCIYEIGSSSCGDIEIGQLFTNRKALINAVRTWSIKKMEIVCKENFHHQRSSYIAGVKNVIEESRVTMDLREWHGPVIDDLLYFQSSHRCHQGFEGKLWSWERLHVGQPILQEEDFVLGDRPLGARWKIFQRFDENTRVLMWYRAQLDYKDQSQVAWQPYIGKYESLPPICRDHHMLWLARVPLICFDIVEMHLPDQFARQFGWHQNIPADVEDMDRVHRRGRQDVNWMEFHQSYIKRWEQHDEHIHQFPRIRNSRGYMEWYWERTVRHITQPPPPRCPPGYIAQVQVTIAHDINEVLARGAVLYPDSNEWGRIVAMTRDLAEAMVEDREQSQYQSSYIASMYDRLDDDVTGADFSESEPMCTIEELFSDLVHLDEDVHEQPHQQSNIPDVLHSSSTSMRPLQTYVHGPCRVFGIIGTSRRPEKFTTPAQPVIPPSQPIDAPSSSTPLAHRKTKTKQNVWKKMFG